jgi:hypothetical protein
MATGTAKCPKCGDDARRTGETLESGTLTVSPATMLSASTRLIEQMACRTCGHHFTVNREAT